MKVFTDHAHKTIYVKASASNQETRAAQLKASALGYRLVYVLGSALKGAA